KVSDDPCREHTPAEPREKFSTNPCLIRLPTSGLPGQYAGSHRTHDKSHHGNQGHIEADLRQFCFVDLNCAWIKIAPQAGNMPQRKSQEIGQGHCPDSAPLVDDKKNQSDEQCPPHQKVIQHDVTSRFSRCNIHLILSCLHLLLAMRSIVAS